MLSLLFENHCKLIKFIKTAVVCIERSATLFYYSYRYTVYEKNAGETSVNTLYTYI